MNKGHMCVGSIMLGTHMNAGHMCVGSIMLGTFQMRDNPHSRYMLITY